MKRLANKAALITGGGAGIGAATAMLFCAEGAAVTVIDADAAALARTLEAVRAEMPGARIEGHAADVADPDEAARAVARALQAFGRLDVLVNNAAFQETQQKLEDISDEQFDTTFRTNIYGYFYMAKAAVKYLPKGGAIVNCGSITGLEGNKTLIDYASTKGAIHAFTKSLAQNLIDRGIRVNCVSPGPIWTPLQPVSKPADKVAEHGAGTRLGRPGQPEEVAPAFVFFASEADSSYINGEILTLLGGETRAG
jgi:NAD(P)-dependent dehydrogenase (short-subunit alcohol dehydrogenase family)